MITIWLDCRRRRCQCKHACAESFSVLNYRSSELAIQAFGGVCALYLIFCNLEGQQCQCQVLRLCSSLCRMKPNHCSLRRKTRLQLRMSLTSTRTNTRASLLFEDCTMRATESLLCCTPRQPVGLAVLSNQFSAKWWMSMRRRYAGSRCLCYADEIEQLVEHTAITADSDLIAV